MGDSSREVRGRGKWIAAALQRAREAKAEVEPPKPKGRAALLLQLAESKKQKVGVALPTKLEQQPSSSALEPSPRSPQPSTSIAQLTQKFAEQEIDKPSVEYKGVSGTALPASANYICLEQRANSGVFEFEVKFEPSVDSKSARLKMLNRALDFCKAKTFDGHVLYVSERFTEGKLDYQCVHPFSDEPIRMSVIYKKKLRISECLHLYNVLFKRIMYILQYKRVGRQFFDNMRPFLVPQHKLEIWPGYAVSVNEFSGGIMLCLDTQHKVLRTQNALEFITDVAEHNRGGFRDMVQKAVLGSVVLTRYNNKTYIVHDIMWDATPLSKFPVNSGGQISFMEYYKKQYDITIRDTEQPMFVNRQTVHSVDRLQKEDRCLMLVPELCFLTGLTDAMRSDFRVMKDIAQYTRITPNQRMNALRKYISDVNNTPEAMSVLSAWGLSIKSATIDLQMRVLEPEVIIFGNDVRIHGTSQADWTSAAMRNRVISSVDFRQWLLLYTKPETKTAEDFVQSIRRLGPKMGIYIHAPTVVCMPDDRCETYLKILRERITKDLQIVCIICPTNRDDRYMTIKKICCAQCPIPSQVIIARTLKNPTRLPAITQKIALQMNCKMGGSLWSLRFPFQKWMICGIDVHHSKTMSGKAVCGFVSSLNEIMTKWYSRCCFHEHDREISSHLKYMFMQALQQFYNYNAYYPTQIVIYRDGVGDGQFDACRNFEIPQLQSVMEELKLNSKLTFIVVQKRINTRIFSMNSRGGDVDNPPPGSIVDDTITRKHLYDFFLVAQQVRQGTVTPTHYVVLRDDGNIKPDHVQRLSYKMCHMYYNWTGTIRVPAPCQYAHKLAYLVGQSVRVLPSDNLCKSLFYL